MLLQGFKWGFVRIQPPQPPQIKDLNFGLSPCFLIIKSSSNVVFLPDLFFKASPNLSFQLSLFFNSLIWFESSQSFGIIIC